MQKPRVRCSELDQLLNCGGSRPLQEAVARFRPEQRTGDQMSYTGDYAHWLAAKTLIEEYGAEGPKGGLQAPALPPGFEPNPFTPWMVSWYVEGILFDTNPDDYLAVEQEFAIEFDRFWLTGHMDCYTLGLRPDGTPWRAALDDLKTGMVAVDAAEINYQVAGYALLLMQSWPGLEELKARIRQPMNDPDERITEVTLNANELQNLPGYLIPKIEESLFERSMEVNSGWKQCRFCTGPRYCPAIRAEIDFMKAKLTPEYLASLTELDNEQLYQLVRTQKLLVPIFDEVKDLLRVRLEAEVQAGADPVFTFGEDGEVRFRNYNIDFIPREHIPEFWERLVEIIGSGAYDAISISKTKVLDALVSVLSVKKTSKKDRCAESIYSDEIGNGLLRKKVETRMLVK